jgi:hypothetical protein
MSAAKPAFDLNPPDPQIKGQLEDIEDLMELRAAVERNAGKPGVPWEQVKVESELD